MLNFQQQKLVTQIAEIFSQYTQDLTGCITPEFYKRSLFGLFIEACTGGYILAHEMMIDALIKNLSDDLFHNDMLSNDDTRLLSEFCTMWDEWLYAWSEGFQRDVITLAINQQTPFNPTSMLH